MPGGHNPYRDYRPKSIVGGTVSRDDLPPLAERAARGQAATPSQQPIEKRPKYGNKKTTTADGILCDSQKEAKRWEELRLLFLAGQITDLLPHPSYPLYVKGTRVGRITFDSLYVENGRLTLEDVKSPSTRANQAYRQRLKNFCALHDSIRVVEYV